MSGFEVWFLTMPFVLMALGATATGIFFLWDNRALRAEAEAEAKRREG